MAAWDIRHRMGIGTSFLALALVTACSLGSADSFRVTVQERDGFAFPTFVRGEAGGPLLVIEGTLIEVNRCLWIESESGRFVVLWPRGFDLIDVNGPTVTGDDQVFRVGDRMTTTGVGSGISGFAVRGVEVMSPECASAAWWMALDPMLEPSET